MNSITFVTGNAGKYRELSAMIVGLIQRDLEVPEVQELDPQVVLGFKLEAAAKLQSGALLVEDTSLTFACLGDRLPGPFIKWFEKELGLAGLAELAAKYSDQSATARATLGYRDEAGQNHYFTGEVHGTIVAPRGSAGFGWDQIFQPKGFDKTFAELGDAKHTMSHRYLAGQQLRKHLGRS